MLGFVKSSLSRLAYWVNDRFPGIKGLVPKKLHRFVLLRVVGMNDQYEQMLRQNPERLFLQNEALPWVSASYRQVLFVGTASYTYQYEKLFADDPDRYTTIDRNPTTKVWGSKHHIVAPIEQIDRHRAPGFFDCIVLSGVLAYRIPAHGDYGLAAPDELRAMLKVLHGVMRPGGLLLVGWNLRDMAQSLAQLGLLEPYFVPTDKTPWGTRKEFPGDPHVFEFYERR
ncbi:MAG: hypothetical protein IKE60_26585 [Reyranella sp.]|jgi:hypothetical protein|uniref:class I SAM-dependent methyltransferase n=1 Tax=Reyranella sp. TaxID=1929291 RepID=UPI0025D108E3|nr:class I SAM-dependent methyltransferase [Reyranella sp.]MBR2818258.1 hypothetical protein [Reyranella sp.]